MRRVSAPYSKLTIVFKPGKHSLRFEMSCIAKIAASDAHAQQAIDAFLAERGGRLEDYFYLPLRGRNKDIVMALSAKDGMPVGWILINPWGED